MSDKIEINKGIKSWALTLAKVVFSVGLIGWLLNRSDLTTILETIKSANLGFVFLAFCLFFVGYFITATRWHLLLKTQGSTVPVWFLVRSFSIATFFNNFLPSTIGGDAYRMYDVWRFGTNKTAAVSVTLIDRFLGMIALVVFAWVASLYAPEITTRIPGLSLYLFLLLCGMVVFVLLVFSTGSRILSKIKLPGLGFVNRLIEKLTGVLQAFQGRHDVLIRVLILSLLLQLNVVLHFYCITQALDIDIKIQALFVIIPLSVLLMMVPISINGIGLREAVFIFFFGLYGVNQEIAIAFAWVVFGLVLAQGLVGGIVFLLRKTALSRETTANE